MPTEQSGFSRESENKDVNFGQEKQKPLSFGQKLVGLTFNPSNDDKVGKAKQLCADLMDLAKDGFEEGQSSFLKTTLYNHTIGEVLNAQMNVVKLLTLKY